MMYVAGSASSGEGTRTGSRIHLKAIEVGAAAPPGVPSINDGGAAQSTTFSTEQGFSSNTFGTVFGSDLTDVTLTWNSAFVDGVAPTSRGGGREFSITANPLLFPSWGTVTTSVRPRTKSTLSFPPPKLPVR